MIRLPLQCNFFIADLKVFQVPSSREHSEFRFKYCFLSAEEMLKKHSENKVISDP